MRTLGYHSHYIVLALLSYCCSMQKSEYYTVARAAALCRVVEFCEWLT